MGASELRARRLERVLRITSFRNVNGYSHVMKAAVVVDLRIAFNLHVLNFSKANRDPEFKFKEATAGNGFAENCSYCRQVVCVSQIDKFFAGHTSSGRDFVNPEKLRRGLDHVSSRIPSPACCLTHSLYER
jgi:hypothetical protein